MFTINIILYYNQAVYVSQVGQDQTAVWMSMNVTGQHLLAVDHIQCASMYRAASAVSVDLDSIIRRAIVLVRICVYSELYSCSCNLCYQRFLCLC